MSEQVLICGCDLQTLRALRVTLRDAGFRVEATGGAAETLDRVALRPPDAVIVELALPDSDGVEVCGRVREWSAMPLIVLSDSHEEQAAVRALEVGADHYMTKPFSPSELVARLRAVLRRVEPAEHRPRIHVGDLEIDLAARMVLRQGKPIRLTPIEYGLLRTVTQHRGRLLTHDELRREVWGGVHLADRRTLRAHIANLRGTIDPGGRLGLIRTLSGAGYVMPLVTADDANRLHISLGCLVAKVCAATDERADLLGLARINSGRHPHVLSAAQPRG